MQRLAANQNLASFTDVPRHQLLIATSMMSTSACDTSPEPSSKFSHYTELIFDQLFFDSEYCTPTTTKDYYIWVKNRFTAICRSHHAEIVFRHGDSETNYRPTLHYNKTAIKNLVDEYREHLKTLFEDSSRQKLFLCVDSHYKLVVLDLTRFVGMGTLNWNNDGRDVLNIIEQNLIRRLPIFKSIVNKNLFECVVPFNLDKEENDDAITRIALQYLEIYSAEEVCNPVVRYLHDPLSFQQALLKARPSLRTHLTERNVEEFWKRLEIIAKSCCSHALEGSTPGKIGSWVVGHLRNFTIGINNGSIVSRDVKEY